MFGGVENGCGRAMFDDFTTVHDGDAIGEVADDTEVVSDKEVGEVV